ncbi:hypothetical protein KIPB_013752 [Kipferlia bialata]|uniref:Uncharacterized protein n=1 Tax=Kipferlia bialata TaxID=797122 RepID=A0A9K3D7V2_9EUKA|nr:hypothetical protein KIPB_013752 [Kipferlia bialata]|eukprot:g13752.t1
MSLSGLNRSLGTREHSASHNTVHKDLYRSPLAKPLPRVSSHAPPPPRMPVKTSPKRTRPLTSAASEPGSPVDNARRRELHTIKARIERSRIMSKSFSVRQDLRQKQEQEREKAERRANTAHSKSTAKWARRMSSSPFTVDLVAEYGKCPGTGYMMSAYGVLVTPQ